MAKKYAKKNSKNSKNSKNFFNKNLFLTHCTVM
jgi:hypothetical protein